MKTTTTTFLGLDLYSTGPPTTNSYLEWASDSYLLLKARSLSYITFLIHRSCWNVFFSCMDFSYSCGIFGKGDPCLEFSMAVSARSGTRRPQPAATRNELTGMNNLKTEHNVRTCSQSRYLCVLHSCRPSTRSAPSRVPPRCHWIQTIPTLHHVRQALDIHTSGGTVWRYSINSTVLHLCTCVPKGNSYIDVVYFEV